MTTCWVWGTGWATATLAGRQRASGLDRCAYSGGPAPEVRDRLFVLASGLTRVGWGRADALALEGAAAGAFDAVGVRVPG